MVTENTTFPIMPTEQAASRRSLTSFYQTEHLLCEVASNKFQVLFSLKCCESGPTAAGATVKNKRKTFWTSPRLFGAEDRRLTADTTRGCDGWISKVGNIKCIKTRWSTRVRNPTELHEGREDPASSEDGQTRTPPVGVGGGGGLSVIGGAPHSEEAGVAATSLKVEQLPWCQSLYSKTTIWLLQCQNFTPVHAGTGSSPAYVTDKKQEWLSVNKDGQFINPSMLAYRTN